MFSIKKYYLIILFGSITLLSIGTAHYLFTQTTQSKKQLIEFEKANISKEDLSSLEMKHKGNVIYKIHCAKCHEFNAKGNTNSPSLIDDKWRSTQSIEVLYNTIALGRNSKGMPDWGTRIQKADIKAIAIYIHSLNQVPNKN